MTDEMLDTLADKVLENMKTAFKATELLRRSGNFYERQKLEYTNQELTALTEQAQNSLVQAVKDVIMLGAYLENQEDATPWLEWIKRLDERILAKLEALNEVSKN